MFSCTLYLSLLNFMRFLLAYSSSLPRPSSRVALPSKVSTFPLSLVSLANFIKVFLIPLSRPLPEILNSPGSSTDPWGSPLVTGCQLKRCSSFSHPDCCLAVSSHPTAQIPCPQQTHKEEEAVTKGENALGEYSKFNHMKSPMCKKLLIAGSSDPSSSP